MILPPPPGFPVCPTQQPDETIPEYAARVLRFLLACQTTASLSDEQLEQADHAAQLAICNLRGTDGRASTAALDPATERTLTILSAARTTAQSALRWRRDAHKAASQETAHSQGGKQPGRPAPLQPPPPSLPPAEDFLTAVRHEVTRQRKQTDDVRF